MGTGIQGLHPGETQFFEHSLLSGGLAGVLSVSQEGLNSSEPQVFLRQLTTQAVNSQDDRQSQVSNQ